MKFKARVEVRLRKAVDDSAGNAVRAACGKMSDMTFNKLRLGKLIEINFEADNEEYANKEIKKLCKNFLANEVIEDYEFKVWSVEK
jgi:phosphoribosylformylglycinamidine synthase PurS subunit|tara:strand:- start:178 stop:435 length:258 start_codon:yes stop_codon:yes gene_type:complete